MSAMTAVQSLEAVKSSAESIRNDATQRFPEAASPGDAFRQGDLYIELLDKLPAGCEVVRKPSAQLAPGTTQGSRHILDALSGVKVYVRKGATVLDGPVLELTKERTVTHPDHGHVALPPGCYAITYQRQFAEELRRVAD